MSLRALITGGTSGIGLSFATRLATEGYDIVIVATNEERLESVASMIKEKFKVDVETIAADLTTNEGISKVENRLLDQNKPIRTFVNNAGIGLKGKFLEADSKEHERVLNINVIALTLLTHAAAKGMVERKIGDIIHVASVAGFGPGFRPSSTYAASKAYVFTFSEGLTPMLAPCGIKVSVVCPGFARSEFHNRAEINMSKIPSFLWLQPDFIAAAALKDHRAGRSVSIPSKRYKTLVYFLRVAPKALVRKCTKIFSKVAH